MPTKKRKTPRETSDAASSDAGKLLALVKDGYKFDAWKFSRGVPAKYRSVHALGKRGAGSAMNQDQTRGPRGRK